MGRILTLVAAALCVVAAVLILAGVIEIRDSNGGSDGAAFPAALVAFGIAAVLAFRGLRDRRG